MRVTAKFAYPLTALLIVCGQAMFSLAGVTPSPFNQQALLLKKDVQLGDHTGYSVAIDQGKAVVGSFNAGATIYQFDGRKWLERAHVQSGRGQARENARLGFAVALSGETAILGAPNDAVGANGAAYIMQRQGDRWQPVAQLIPRGRSSEILGAEFGAAVAISGKTVIVGEPRGGSAFNAEGDGNETGTAYIFEANGNRWVQTAKLNAPDAVKRDQFGRAVAINGNIAVVGAPAKATQAGASAGKVYVYRREGSGWKFWTQLTAADARQGNFLGFSVAVEGSTLIAGAPGASQASGAVYLYELKGKRWVQTRKLTAPRMNAKDQFGYSVAIASTGVIVGAPAATGQWGGSGAAFVYPRGKTGLHAAIKLIPRDESFSGEFGFSVGVSGAQAIVGAHNTHTAKANSSGAAYVFYNSMH